MKRTPEVYTKLADHPIETGEGEMPLLDRFPALRELPRVRLCDLPSPIEKLPAFAGTSGGEMWIKRDDLNAAVCGGNKVRALEFLLGGVKRGDTVLTVGGAGSTHVLSTAVHAARLGARVAALRWTHDMNPVAEIVSSRIGSIIPGSRVGRSTLLALTRARLRTVTSDVLYIPLGGSSSLGVIGHVNAALELAGQIARGAAAMPQTVVLPLGSGGSAAGLVLGFAIAGIDVVVVGARVGPRMFVNQRRVLRLARQTSRFIARITGEDLPGIDSRRLRIAHTVYGGAYGRPLTGAAEAAEMLRGTTGIQLDATYSAKAFVAALGEARTAGGGGPTLFWLTFDARCLTN